jgi:hypothetical protein
MLYVIMLNIFMLCVVSLNVVMLKVVAPFVLPQYFYGIVKKMTHCAKMAVNYKCKLFQRNI